MWRGYWLKHIATEGIDKQWAALAARAALLRLRLLLGDSGAVLAATDGTWAALQARCAYLAMELARHPSNAAVVVVRDGSVRRATHSLPQVEEVLLELEFSRAV